MFLLLISTVNNVGMMYCTHFSYFLQVPNAQQVCLCSILLTQTALLNYTLNLDLDFASHY